MHWEEARAAKKRAVLIAVAALFAALYVGGALAYGTVNPRRLAEAVSELIDPSPFRAEVVKGSTGRRVYLIHGLAADPTYWRQAPYDALLNHLEREGDEIVLVALPKLVDSDIMDGGAQYCSDFRKWFKRLDTKLGPTKQTTIIGASWGGWHALQVADIADRLLIFKPAIDPGKLSEYWWVGPTGCSLRRAPQSLAVYTPTDDRVGDATAALKGLGIPTLPAIRPDHGIEPADVAKGMAWLDITR